ncbi:hypothetical protein [Streptomonospora salina]|uniref:Lipoprotein n=1 Tax=Streptomonospora salina TaxID=104205 RepID=A0A841EEY1_9ACTN|nr:hypothetical protein [Streptomonospora salina]MBB5999889.1 hypothetical protein [Streptomonospora salina]
MIENTVTSCSAAASLIACSSAIAGSTPAITKSSVPMTKAASSRHTSHPLPPEPLLRETMPGT